MLSEELLALSAQTVFRVHSNIVLILEVSPQFIWLHFLSGRACSTLVLCILWGSIVVPSSHLALDFFAFLLYLEIFLPVFLFLSSADDKGLD